MIIISLGKEETSMDSYLPLRMDFSCIALQHIMKSKAFMMIRHKKNIIHIDKTRIHLEKNKWHLGTHFKTKDEQSDCYIIV